MCEMCLPESAPPPIGTRGPKKILHKLAPRLSVVAVAPAVYQGTVGVDLSVIETFGTSERVNYRRIWLLLF